MNTLTAAFFRIDTVPDKIFPGYTDGKEWNGWARPYFSFEISHLIVDSLSHYQPGQYDAEADEFVFVSEEEEEHFGVVEIEGKKLYPIGAGSWIWEQAT